MQTTIKIITHDNDRAELKKHAANLYSLTITSRNIGRNRWGTLEEISQDVKHFEATGNLPSPKYPKW